MAEFEPAVELTLKHEGGYVNDPHDRGGETNFGISKREYPSLDIKNLTVEKAKEIYRHDYWLFEHLDDQQVANKLFDMSVVMGVRKAVQLFQSAIVACGHVIPIDGIWGPRTCYTANVIPPAELLETFCQECAIYFKKLADAAPYQKEFLMGWLDRVDAA